MLNCCLVRGARSQSIRAMSTKTSEFLCVHVYVTCKSGTEDQFKAASLANARASAKEEGVARFDVMQQLDDPCKFILLEVFKNEGAPALHKETEHYKTWRETVQDMMAEPRRSVKCKNLFPVTSDGWDYGDTQLE